MSLTSINSYDIIEVFNIEQKKEFEKLFFKKNIDSSFVDIDSNYHQIHTYSSIPQEIVEALMKENKIYNYLNPQFKEILIDFLTHINFHKSEQNIPLFTYTL